ncbi:hypothetical protein C8R46DRAFT_1026536 [Mycena filopes]|nr:hypothetical protein C8R46DRAFT_1026536 [Mycena filopes]
MRRSVGVVVVIYEESRSSRGVARSRGRGDDIVNLKCSRIALARNDDALDAQPTRRIPPPATLALIPIHPPLPLPGARVEAMRAPRAAHGVDAVEQRPREEARARVGGGVVSGVERARRQRDRRHLLLYDWWGFWGRGRATAGEGRGGGGGRGEGEGGEGGEGGVGARGAGAERRGAASAYTPAALDGGCGGGDGYREGAAVGVGRGVLALGGERRGGCDGDWVVLRKGVEARHRCDDGDWGGGSEAQAGFLRLRWRRRRRRRRVGCIAGHADGCATRDRSGEGEVEIETRGELCVPGRGVLAQGGVGLAGSVGERRSPRGDAGDHSRLDFAFWREEEGGEVPGL